MSTSLGIACHVTVLQILLSALFVKPYLHVTWVVFTSCGFFIHGWVVGCLGKYDFVLEFDHQFRVTFAIHSVEGDLDGMVDIGEEMAVISVLSRKSDSNYLLVSIEVSKTIARWLREGMEVELVWVIHDEVRKDVSWANSDEVGAEVALTHSVSILLWVETEHFVAGDPISGVDQGVIVDSQIEGDIIDH